MDYVMWLMVCGVCFLAGAVVGGLIVRNNYKSLRLHEEELKKLIIDDIHTNDQIILRIRNRFNI